MNQQWRQFLESQSATVSETGTVSFENGQQLMDSALFDLSHLRLFKYLGMMQKLSSRANSLTISVRYRPNTIR
jgi:hypothetical protein